MRVANWVAQGIVVATFFALLVSPQKWGFLLGLVSLGVVGVWALLYPQGVLGWAKAAHPSIDVDDSSLWWVPRLIGAFFVAFALTIALFGFLRWGFPNPTRKVSMSAIDSMTMSAPWAR